MAIEDILVSFNPMDIVKGYEYGQEKGRARESHESQMERERMLNEITRVRDVPAARFAGASTEAKLAGFDPTLEKDIYQLSRTQAGAEQAMTAAEANRKLNQLPERLKYRDIDDEDRWSEAAARAAVAQRRAERTGGVATAETAAVSAQEVQAEQQGQIEARDLMRAAEAAEREAQLADPKAPLTDEWERATKAYAQAKSPAARDALMKHRDSFALRQMTGAARNSDVAGMNMWLQRYGKNEEVAAVTLRDNQGRDHLNWQRVSIQRGTDSAGNPTVTRTPIPGAFYGVDPGRTDWIGYQLPAILGLEGPPQQRGARPAPGTTPPPPRRTTPAQRPAPAGRGAPAPTETEANPEAAGAAAGGRREVLTPKQKSDIEDMKARQSRQLQDEQRRRQGNAAMQEQQRLAEKLGEGYTALREEEQAVARTLSDQADTYRKLLASQGGNTPSNRVVAAGIQSRLEALISEGYRRVQQRPSPETVLAA